MDKERFKVEKDTLTKYLPEGAFSFNDMDSDEPYLEVNASTRIDNRYLLRIELNVFPEYMPKVYILSICPKGESSWTGADLYNYEGESLKKVSHKNHTLSPHPIHNWVQICHYNPGAWRPDISLWFVYLKCIFWLNAYECFNGIARKAQEILLDDDYRF